MNRRIRAGIAIMAFILLFAIAFGGEGDVDLSIRLMPPSAGYLFGCDTFGRDLMERTAGGILVSMSIALAVAFLSMALGIAIGSASSLPHLSLLAALTDSLKSLPPVVLALFLVTLSGPGPVKLVLSLSLAHIANVSRSVHSKVRILRKTHYAETARLQGMNGLKLYIVHILPNMKGYLAAQYVSVFSSAMLAESSLSFLGCGVRQPIPSLGSILAEARPVMLSSWWMILFPALFLFLIALSLGLISKGASELDPSSH